MAVTIEIVRVISALRDGCGTPSHNKFWETLEETADFKSQLGSPQGQMLKITCLLGLIACCQHTNEELALQCVVCAETARYIQRRTISGSEYLVRARNLGEMLDHERSVFPGQRLTVQEGSCDTAASRSKAA